MATNSYGTLFGRRHKIVTRYVTKYALTKGILEINAILGTTTNWTDEFPYRNVGYHGQTDVHDFATLEEAQTKARKMRKKKVKALKKKLIKLQNIRFKVAKKRSYFD